LVGGCASTAREAPPAADRGRETVVLVSLDGFRWDYLDRGLTPNLSRLAREGVRAAALVPVFPTKTFPNHYTIAAASALWYGLLVYLGALASRNWDAILDFFSRASSILLAIAVVLIAGVAWWWWRSRERQ
jgi:hypothetical protein